jgi:hypothetical protein
MLASFVDEYLIPFAILYALIFIAIRFFTSKSRRADEAYRKGGAGGLVQFLKSGYLKGESMEEQDLAGVIDLARRKIEGRKEKTARLERLFSIKTTFIVAGILIGVLTLTLLGHILLGLSSKPFQWTALGIISLFGLFMLAGFAASMILTTLNTSYDGILRLLDQARADLAGGVPPETPTPSAPAFEATYAKAEGHDYDAVRAELGGLFAKSWFKPWMGSLPVFVLLGVQLFLTTGEHYGESSYDNPWLLLFLFTLATLMEFLVAIRFVYFAHVSLYSQKGPEGLKGHSEPLTSDPGSQALLVFTMMGLVPSVFGFVFFFVCSNWPVSLAFHAVSLFWVFNMQFRMESFTDRMAENVIFLAGQPEGAIGLRGIVRVGRRMFSREMG